MKNKSMLDMLYHGGFDNLIPARPDDPEYDEIYRSYSLMADEFEATLSPEQKKCFEELQDKYTNICSIERECSFKLGFKIAVGLLTESHALS